MIRYSNKINEGMIINVCVIVYVFTVSFEFDKTSMSIGVILAMVSNSTFRLGMTVQSDVNW